jgi:hypothetical protein
VSTTAAAKPKAAPAPAKKDGHDHHEGDGHDHGRRL